MSIKSLYQSFKHPLQMFGLYLVGTITDFVSSMHLPKGLQESNPFARHLDGSFWPAHALINCSINTLEIALLTVGLYCGLRLLDRRWAQTLASVPFLYYGYMHLDAAVSNIQLRWPGLYVPETFNVLNFLKGLVS